MLGRNEIGCSVLDVGDSSEQMHRSVVGRNHKVMVDVSSVHALHASAVSTEMSTKFTELREVTSQFRAGSCENFGRD